MIKKRKICVFSGKRGGFGAYVPFMRLVESDPDLQLQILLGDMHAATEFGNTANEVRKLFPNSPIEIVEMGTGRNDSSLARAENLGVCLSKSAQALSKLNPDIVMVHGDRGEHLMVAFAALNLGKAVAHTQGGEVSGNIDDVQRHAITKLSHIHFPETQEAAGNIKKLGEEVWRIHIVGSLYIDRIIGKMYVPEKEAREKYGLNPDEDYFIVIFHPDTFESSRSSKSVMENIIGVLERSDLKSLVLYPCSDPGYQGIVEVIEKARSNPNFLVYGNIENLDFLGLMSGAKAIIGNSSSALKEAPYFKLAALNIGRRQKGRQSENNVHTVKMGAKDIEEGLNFILNNNKFKAGLKSCGFSLGNGHASEKVLNIIKKIDLDEKLLRKHLQ